MKTYEVLDHTSGAGLKVYGETLPELFENAACGMRDIMVDSATVRPVRHLNIQVEGENIEALLAEWLTDLIYLFDAKGFVPLSFRVTEMEKQYLLAEVHGEHYDEEVHDLRAVPKKVKQDSLSIKKDGRWFATVVVDV